jgi:hypothetical protein
VPLFSRDFAVYKNCLQYQRDKLCDLLEEDLKFWTLQFEKTSGALSKSAKRDQLIGQI